MSIDLTEEQRQAVVEGQPVRLHFSELGGEVVVLPASRFDELQAMLDVEREQAIVRAYARKQASRLASEHPY